MNRLSPLIVRRATAIAMPIESEFAAPGPDLVEDLRFFLTIWAGGLVFFATFLG